MPYLDPIRRRANQARYRATRREYFRAKRAERQDAVTEAHALRVNSLKAAGCADCGAADEGGGTTTTTLHFHHLNPDTQAYRIADMRGYSDASFYAEVAKCVLVCQPCHQARHRELRAQPAA